MKNPYSKRKDGRMYKEIILGRDENGKYKKKMLYSRKGESWRDFDKRVHEAMNNVKDGKYIDESLTVSECCDIWFRTKRNISPGSISTYKCVLNKIKNGIGYIKVKDLTTFNITLFYNDLYDEGCKCWGKMIATLLNSVLDFAVDNGLIVKNVARKAKPIYDRHVKSALSEADDKKVHDGLFDLPAKHRAMVAILYYTGIRRGELLALTKSDINLDNCWININKTVVDDADYNVIVSDHPKTKHGNRIIPIPETLRKILIEYIDSLDSNELFLTRDGKHYSRANFGSIWRTIVKYLGFEAGSGFTAHSLRHNYITKMIYSGAAIKTVQYLAGHASASLTLNVYTSIRIDKEEILSQVNKCFAD